MNLTEAEAFVTLRAAATSEPTVSSLEIRDLLNELAITEDADCVEPDDEDWVPTYSRLGCYKVLAELWTIKAGRVAHRFDFTAPTSGGNFRVSQIQDHCEAQAKRYARYVNESANAL